MARVEKDKDINGTLRGYFPIGFYLGLFDIAGIILTAIGAAAPILGLLIAGVIVLPIAGVSTFFFVRALTRLSSKVVFLKAFRFEKIRSVDMLARRCGVAPDKAREALIYLIAKNYIVGYAFNEQMTELVSTRGDAKSVTVVCHSCGDAVSEGENFCPSCGTPIIWGKKKTDKTSV
jgi:predicted RNA-binding Zn-ribbon protein involved in translation (DUF1610 family)